MSYTMSAPVRRVPQSTTKASYNLEEGTISKLISKSELLMERKMEALVQEKLSQTFLKMNQSVTKLEGRIDSIVETNTRRGVLLEREIDEIRQSQIEKISNKFEKYLQSLQVQPPQLQNALPDLKLQRSLQSPRVAHDSLQQTRLDMTQTTLDTTQSSCAASSPGMPPSTTLEATDEVLQPRGLTAALESRIAMVEARLGAVGEQKEHSEPSEAAAKSLDSLRRQLMEEISGVERTCAQLEASGLEVRDETSQLQVQVVQLQAQFLMLEGQMERLQAQRKKAPEQQKSTDVTEAPKQEVHREAEGEVSLLASECKKMSIMIEQAAKDFLSSRQNTDSLLDEVKGLVKDFDSLKLSTTEKHVRLDDAINKSAAVAQSDVQAMNSELEQLRAICSKLEAGCGEIKDLRGALHDLQDCVQSPQTKDMSEASKQALSTLQTTLSSLSARVDRLMQSEQEKARAAHSRHVVVVQPSPSRQISSRSPLRQRSVTRQGSISLPPYKFSPPPSTRGRSISPGPLLSTGCDSLSSTWGQVESPLKSSFGSSSKTDLKGLAVHPPFRMGSSERAVYRARNTFPACNPSVCAPTAGASIITQSSERSVDSARARNLYVPPARVVMNSGVPAAGTQQKRNSTTSI